MQMNPQDYELIALSHVLARYRISGELPAINGQPFNINNFKQALFNGVSTDTDININIEKVENTVVDCDNEQDTIPESAEQALEEIKQEPVPETSVPEIKLTDSEPVKEEKSSISGKLFQFFTKDGKNES
jgi:hypothetical protein